LEEEVTALDDMLSLVFGAWCLVLGRLMLACLLPACLPACLFGEDGGDLLFPESSVQKYHS
jgi:hypothetical protein